MTMQAQVTQKGVAIVSGGSGYLGEAIVTQLSAKGYSAVACSRSVETILSGPTLTYQCDLANEKEVADMVADIEHELGQIVLGVHAAQSPIIRKGVTQVNFPAFKEQFSVPVFGGFHFFCALARVMSARSRGVLIGVTSSALEDVALPGGYGGYISAKFALRGLLHELRSALLSSGVKVYEVAPGYMEGGMNADLPEKVGEFLLQKTGARALTTPLDIAVAVGGIADGSSGEFLHVIDRVTEKT